MREDDREPGQTLVCLSYRRPDLFHAMAASVAEEMVAGRAPGLQVSIVVNQDPLDQATFDLAREFQWRAVSYGQNLSFSAGNNRAIAEQVQTSHVVLLNNDAVLRPGVLAALWRERTHPIVGVVVLDQGGQVTHGGGDLDRRLLPYHHDRDVPYVARTGLRRCWWTTFACVQIDVALWTRLRGLDESYAFGYEDVDFCLRAVEVGIAPVVALDAEIVHPEHGTRRAMDDGTNFAVWQRTWRNRLPVLHERADPWFEAGPL